jgi:hydrogenase nickel incorporation protein HypA/HybF
VHELGIASAALDQTLAQLRDAGGVRVLRIVLRVGEFSGVDSDALRFAFESILPGTPAATAAVDIQRVPAAARCDHCGTEYRPDSDPFLQCPNCGRVGGTLVRGRELELLRLEID